MSNLTGVFESGLNEALEAVRGKRGTSGAGKLGAGAVGLGVLAIGGFAAYFIAERMQEEAAFTVLEEEGAFALRRYKPFLTAQTTRTGSRSAALESAFEPLANYIFAKPGGRETGEGGRKIAMTVPVTAVPSENASEWKVRFTLPRKWSRYSLPAPAEGVEIGEQPARTVAVITFPGRATDEALVARQRAKLLRWIEQKKLLALGEPEFAGYNAPIIPGFLRRNELWVEVDWAAGPVDS